VIEKAGHLAKEDGLQRRKIHPHKFMMWLSMGSITMMFAGLTSAYMVREGQSNWRVFDLPFVFWISTAAILLSSVTMYLGLRAFKQRQMQRYRFMISSTLLLGVLFGVLQVIGFYQLYSVPQKLTLLGAESDLKVATVRVDGNPSESFLFIITGLHLAHILGGIIALLVVFLLAYRKRVKVYNATGLEVVSTYWHFVDLLWIYLFIFLVANH
jgi:cytochrome c oxidase subunit III